MAEIITKTFDIWTTAQALKTSNRGRSASNQSLLGIKKLRELILELAVRGKLVHQDPNEEPASELLKKIDTEKRYLVKDGKIKKQEGSTKVGEDEKPFDLPKGWEWTRIRSVGHDWGQKTPDTDFTYIEVSAIDNTKGEVKSPTILTASEAPSRARKIVKHGTVIYSTVRPYLKNICVIDQEYSPEPIASTAFAILHPYIGMPGRFFLFYFQSPVFVSYVESVQNGIAYPAINDKQFFSGLIPLPPLAEQHRIVAKVDELMALCDQLEQQQTESNAAHETLVEVLLGTLTNADSPTEFVESWQRISAHFNDLFTTEHSIDQLKLTILQLAVTGKLTPQNPEDEPASELLKRIAKEKARLVKEGKIKKQAPLPAITEDEKPFELPMGWGWARFGTLFEVTSSKRIHVNDYVSCGVPFFRSKEIGELMKGKNISTDIFISTDKYAELKDLSGFPQDGDLMLTSVGSIGNSWICDGRDFYYKDGNITKIGSHKHSNMRYVQIFIDSPLFSSQVNDTVSGTAYNALTIVKLNNITFPLPPLDEQHRIVSKVDELFALCDTIKERINQAQTTQNQLAGAVVEQALG